MPGIGKGDFQAVRLNGLQNASFCMMLECVDGKREKPD
jgi:hypothetical protein